MHTYLLALGSNLGESRVILRESLGLLSQTTEGKIQAVAPLFATNPIGGIADRVFLNSATMLCCPLEPEVLLEKILKVESLLGRQRQKRWENRILDVDILLWQTTGGTCKALETPFLTIPHPRLLERDFMLVPASLIGPDWIHPHTQTSLIAECNKRGYLLGPPVRDDAWPVSL